MEGPYHDALGKPLFENGKWDHIDPTVWIDENNQAYIGWGNPRFYSAKLSEDMIHLDSELKCDSTIQRYVEGPWTYVGEVMPQTNETNSFTNHSGIIEFKGHNYFFYHTGWPIYLRSEAKRERRQSEGETKVERKRNEGKRGETRNNTSEKSY